MAANRSPLAPWRRARTGAPDPVGRPPRGLDEVMVEPVEEPDSAQSLAKASFRRRVGLRNRITLLFPALTLLLTSLVAVGVYQVVRASQIAASESQAKESAYRNASIIQDRFAAHRADVGRVLDALDRPAGGETVFAFDDNKSADGLSWYSTNSATISHGELPTRLEQLVTRDRQPAIQRYRLNGERPVVAVGVPIETLGASYFEVTPQDGLQSTLDNLAVALPGAVALTTVVAIMLGRWVSKAALAPLTEVSRAAEAIAADKLDTRLPESTDPELSVIINSFNNMAAALQQRVERDARFASDVSHELRSPLMTLAASVEVLQRRRDEMPARAVSALDLLAGDVQRFQSLVADLLEISRFDSGTQELEVGPLVVADLLAGASRAVTGGEVVVQHKPGVESVVIVADRRRLVQVLTNLLDNADKYGNGIHCITLDLVSGGVEIGVEDNGPGVPPSERELIFDRFARGSNAGKRGSDTGTGLGLSLVMEHIRLHGGQVWCTDTRSGQGARFAFFLPTETSTLGDAGDDEEEMADAPLVATGP